MLLLLLLLVSSYSTRVSYEARRKMQEALRPAARVVVRIVGAKPAGLDSWRNTSRAHTHAHTGAQGH